MPARAGETAIGEGHIEAIGPIEARADGGVEQVGDESATRLLRRKRGAWREVVIVERSLGAAQS